MNGSLQYMAVVFDLDGTLIDSTDGIVASFEATFSSLTLDWPGRDAVIRTISMPLEDQIEELGIADAPQFIAAYREHYREMSPGRTGLFPGAREILHDLAQAPLPIGIATSKSKPAAELLLRHLGVFDLFRACIGREDVTNPKPHPEPLLMAAKKLNVAPSQMVYVGDSPYDVESARRAGAISIAVTTGAGGRTVLDGSDPHAIFENLDQVSEHLRIHRPVA